MPKLKLSPYFLAHFRSDGYPSSLDVAQALYPEVAEVLAAKIETAINAPVDLDLTDDEAMCLAASMDSPRWKLPDDQAQAIAEWYDRWLSSLPPVKCNQRGCEANAIWYYEQSENHYYRCDEHAGENRRYSHRIGPKDKT